MKQLILLATLCIIFFWTSCQLGKEKNPVVFFPDKITKITSVDGTREDVLSYLNIDLSTFFQSHQELLKKDVFLVGNTKRNEKLFLQSFESDLFQKWLENHQLTAFEFRKWNIYQLEIENGRMIYVSYSDGYLWISNRGHLLEESLLVMDGKVNGLVKDSPEIKQIILNESFGRFKDFPLIDWFDIGNTMNLSPLLEAKTVGEIKKDSLTYFKGDFFLNSGLKIEEDSLWYQMLFLIPNDIVYLGIYQFSLTTKNIFKGKSDGAFASFLLGNKVGEDYPFLMVNTKGSAHDLMNDLEKEHGILEEINENLFPIKRILTNDLCNSEKDLLFLPCINNPYVVMIGDYLIFTNTLESMEQYLESYVSSQIITNNKLVNSSLANCKKIKGSYHYFKGFDNKESVLILDEEEGKSIYKGLYLIQNASKKESGIKKVSTYYNSNKITSDIFVLPAKNEKEYIIFQDETGQLYFLNKKNELIHSLDLGAQIISDIHHYKDKETHLNRYIFNTKNKVYILNSEAESIRNFPLELSSAASNGIGMIDVKNTRSTYAFLSCENENLYGYNLTKGFKPMPSWNPLIGTGALKENMVFLEGNDETHFVYINNKNELISLDRKAVSRFKPIVIEEEYGKKIQIDVNIKDKERLVLHNGKSKLKIINTKGKEFSLLLNNENKEGQFLLIDLLGNQQKEYVFLNKEFIYIHTYEGDDFKLKNKIDNSYGITELFEVELSEEKSLLGGINQSKNKVYLFDSEGKLVNGFPLEGSAPFKLMKQEDNHYLIFTIMEERMVTYALSI